MMIKGLQKLTLLDFPERIACTVFLGGCNFRCPFCHNASLVLPCRESCDISEEELFNHLESRRGRLSGVCISGGEPTLHPDLGVLIKKIKALGYAVKLDTNGYRPDVLESLLGEGLLDYVAMDIKNCPSGYSETAGVEGMDVSLIEKSARLLMSSGIPFEFRTTVVRQLHTKENIRAMGEWLAGDHKMFLQSFEDSGDVISPGLSAYSPDEMRELLEVLREYMPNSELRSQ